MDTKRKPSKSPDFEEELRLWEKRFESLIELSSEWYWEQDESFRFTLVTGSTAGHGGFDPKKFIGTYRWDRGAIPLGDGGTWDKHKAVLEAKQPFTDFLFARTDSKGGLRYISTSGQPVLDEKGRFRGYRGIARDVTQSKRAEQLLGLEHAITRHLANAERLSDALKAVLREVCESQDWDVGRYFMVDDKAGVLRFVESWSKPDPALEEFLAASTKATFAPGVGLAGTVWQTGKPVWVPDLNKDGRARLVSSTVRTGIRGAFHFPAVAEGKTIGVVTFSSREIREPDERLLRAVGVIGSQIGQFVQRKQAEEVVRTSAERFRALTALSSDFYWETDAQHRLVETEYDRKVQRVVPRSIRSGKTRWELPSIYPDAAGWAAHRATVEAHLPFKNFELGRIDADGVERHLSISGEPVLDAQGNFQGYRGVGTDITARKRAERVLRDSEERFRALTELSSDLYWTQDSEHRFTSFSGSNATAPQRLIGKKRWEEGAANLTEADWAAHRAVLDAHQPFRDFEVARVNEKGDMFWVAISGAPVFDEAGRFAGYRGIVRNISERKRAEQLREMEHTVTRSLAEAESASGALKEVIRAICGTQGWECGRYFRVDGKAGVLRFAEGWSIPVEAIEGFIARSRDLTYAPGAGLAGLTWQTAEPVWSSDIAKDPRVAQVKLAHDTGMHGAFLFPITSEGKVIGVFTFNSREIREPGQRLLQAISVIGNQIGQFLERKQAEEEILRFRTAMDVSADLVFLCDPTTMVYVDVNATACRALGYSREELLQLGPQDILPASREEMAQVYERLIAGDLSATTHETWYRRKDGTRFRMESFRRALRSAKGHVIVIVARDITERKRAEELQAIEHTVTRCLTEADSVNGALKAVMRVVCETLGWECGRYFRKDESAGVFRFAESWYVPSAALDRFIAYSHERTFVPGVGIVGMAGAGEPQWVADVTKDARVINTKMMAGDHGMRGAFMFPVMADGKSLGVLSFTSREIREPDQRLLLAARVIGAQIGQFLQRKRAEEVVRESEERFRGLTELSSDMYWEQDDQFRFTSMSGMGSARVNLKTFPAIGKKRWEQNYINMTADQWAEHIALLEAHKEFRDMELCRLDESGKKIWVSVSGEPVFDSSGVFKGYRGVGKDITDRKGDEEHIHFLANHDALTSLPNRAMFGDVLGLAIQNARRYSRGFAVLFIDLDRFKNINDTLGHDSGDKLLQEMAKRLSQTVRASDVVARLGGDEFVVLVQEVSEAKQVASVARKVLSAVVHPVSVMGQECRVTASIGICMYPTEAQDEKALMKNADIAMYRAKEDGKNNFKFYSEEMNVHSFERLALETSLRRGLERSEFLLHYQAKVDLNSRRITGVEALVRWQHPEMGMVPPAQFIPLAEETGLIVPIGKWVLHTACAQSVAWQRQGLPPVHMAVNLSARQFADEDLVEDIAIALKSTGLKPELLELELTESMVIQNTERAGRVLNEIKKMGVRLAIDDFGVGYSSLTHLKRFPIDTLKVDRSFIRDLPEDIEDKAITEAIIAMGKSLNLTVVAEGVETEEQQNFLQEHACDEMQGYFFSKPIAAEAFADLLRQRVAASKQ